MIRLGQKRSRAGYAHTAEAAAGGSSSTFVPPPTIPAASAFTLLTSLSSAASRAPDGVTPFSFGLAVAAAGDAPHDGDSSVSSSGGGGGGGGAMPTDPGFRARVTPDAAQWDTWAHGNMRLGAEGVYASALDARRDGAGSAGGAALLAPALQPFHSLALSSSARAISGDADSSAGGALPVAYAVPSRGGWWAAGGGGDGSGAGGGTSVLAASLMPALPLGGWNAEASGSCVRRRRLHEEDGLNAHVSHAHAHTPRADGGGDGDGGGGNGGGTEDGMHVECVGGNGEDDHHGDSRSSCSSRSSRSSNSVARALMHVAHTDKLSAGSGGRLTAGELRLKNDVEECSRTLAGHRWWAVQYVAPNCVSAFVTCNDALVDGITHKPAAAYFDAGRHWPHTVGFRVQVSKTYPHEPPLVIITHPLAKGDPSTQWRLPILDTDLPDATSCTSAPGNNSAMCDVDASRAEATRRAPYRAADGMAVDDEDEPAAGAQGSIAALSPRGNSTPTAALPGIMSAWSGICTPWFATPIFGVEPRFWTPTRSLSDLLQQVHMVLRTRHTV